MLRAPLVVSERKLGFFLNSNLETLNALLKLFKYVKCRGKHLQSVYRDIMSFEYKQFLQSRLIALSRTVETAKFEVSTAQYP